MIPKRPLFAMRKTVRALKKIGPKAAIESLKRSIKPSAHHAQIREKIENKKFDRKFNQVQEQVSQARLIFLKEKLKEDPVYLALNRFLRHVNEFRKTGLEMTRQEYFVEQLVRAAIQKMEKGEPVSKGVIRLLIQDGFLPEPVAKKLDDH